MHNVSPDSANPFAELRKDYMRNELNESGVADNPLSQFTVWMNEALHAGLPEPNAMTLATVGLDLKPSSRVVLLKSFDQRGFVFYTNYHSRKGRQIEVNPQVALSFFWAELERQVRIEGRVELTSADESDAYYLSRPEGARLGAHASPQSSPIPNRDLLETRLRELELLYADQDIPRPNHWGGYRVVPERFEFWQGRASRLHDRIVYLRSETEGLWSKQRLAP